MMSLNGRHVLVVEDDYVIATDILDMLTTAGAVPVGPIGWEDEALALVTDAKVALDLAILDIDLHGTPSYRIADALTARRVPLVFATGFNSEAVAQAYRTYPRLEKPVSQRALLAALAGQA